MQGNIMRIKQLQNMIAEREELLKDEMAIALLGNEGVEAIKHFIELYKEKLDKLVSAPAKKNTKYYSVHSQIYDSGYVKYRVEAVKCCYKPNSHSHVTTDYDIHIDWFDTYEQANLFGCQMTSTQPSFIGYGND